MSERAREFLTRRSALMLPFRDVEKLHDDHRSELESVQGVAERNRRLVELHAWSQAKTLLQRPAVAEAMRTKQLKVHAFVYDSSKGECMELLSAEEP